jgi:hypothetical protein
MKNNELNPKQYKHPSRFKRNQLLGSKLFEYRTQGILKRLKEASRNSKKASAIP